MKHALRLAAVPDFACQVQEEIVRLEDQACTLHAQMAPIQAALHEIQGRLAALRQYLAPADAFVPPVVEPRQRGRYSPLKAQILAVLETSAHPMTPKQVLDRLRDQGEPSLKPALVQQCLWRHRHLFSPTGKGTYMLHPVSQPTGEASQAKAEEVAP